MEIRDVLLELPAERAALERFLAARGLDLDRDIEYAAAAWERDLMIGCGAISGPVLKCIAVSESSRGGGVAAAIVSRLIAEQQARGRHHLFVFTRPENEPIFGDLGFVVVERCPPRVSLLENNAGAFGRYLAELRAAAPGGPAAAAVVNCNPFTLGHRWLLETAAARSAHLLVFVLQEDRSAFPAAVRLELVRQGLADLPNVRVLPSGPYIISAATFPSYFLKCPTEAVETHARLDLRIFGAHIAPAAGIERRFVGEEPFDAVTAAYNRQMVEILPAWGVEVSVLPRLEREGRAISASLVRQRLRQGDLAGVRPLVPETTWRYLTSEAAAPVLRRLQASQGRH